MNPTVYLVHPTYTSATFMTHQYEEVYIFMLYYVLNLSNSLSHGKDRKHL